MTATGDEISDAGLAGSGDEAGIPTSIGRKSVLMGMAASMGFVLANAGQTPAAAAAALTSVPGISVIPGDGVADNTIAVRAAIVAAAGAEVYFPKGTYVLDNLLVDTTARLRLDPAATLLAKPNSPSGYMFAFTGTELRIRGGTINGNKANQVIPNPKGRPVIIAGAVQQGKTVDVAEVYFTGTVKAAFYLTDFGGLLSVEHCLFTDQSEHTGVRTVGLSMIVYVTSGEVGKKGYLRFNHNRAIGTVTPKLPGSNPGGVFVSTTPKDGTTPLVGNLTTLEATGNYFWGYGQYCDGDGISPIHLYRSTMGARITNNYFEQCSYSAISAKSVTDFVCTNNVFIGGAISTQNMANEGVISYVPGYNAGSVVQPRGVITGNIIEKAGGQSATVLQHGIAVHGTSTSHGTDIIVAGNVINGGGAGIQVVYADDIKISGNIIKSGGVGIQVNYVHDAVISGNIVQGGSGAAVGSQSGISLGQMSGEVLIADNVIKTLNGHGMIAVTAVNTARFTVQGNKILHAAAGYYAAVLRGMAFLKVSGNEFNATAGVALSVAADAAANKVGRLAYDLSNTVAAGNVSFVWPDILKATGQLRAPLSPLRVVTPGEIGTSYQQSDGVGDLWVSRGTTSSSWTKVLRA
jgi:Right handed beta helix region